MPCGELLFLCGICLVFVRKLRVIQGAIVEVVRRDIISGWWLVCYCDQVGKIPSMKLALVICLLQLIS